MTQEEIIALRAQFEKHVDKRSRLAMVAFLGGHHRYDTMNSWNASTSYAHCIKVHHITWPQRLNRDVLYELCDSHIWGGTIRQINRAWEDAHKPWQVGTNGRSSGYLVLYNGEIKDGRVVCYPGRSLDMHESFDKTDGWDMSALKQRVELVQSFDSLAADLAVAFAQLAETGHFEDDVVTVQQPVRAFVANA